MKIILLAGFAGSGKDTVASILVNQKGYTRFAFADPIKEEMAAELNQPLELFHSVEGKKQFVLGKTLREHCISHGEFKRAQDPEYWVKETAKRIVSSGKQNIVISDWRLLPELFGLQKAFPDAQIIPIRIQKAGQYVSSVPDLTEYGLMGFPFSLILQNRAVSLDELYLEMMSLEAKNVGLW
jgi:dephospho-CoA kinase